MRMPCPRTGSAEVADSWEVAGCPGVTAADASIEASSSRAAGESSEERRMRDDTTVARSAAMAAAALALRLPPRSSVGREALVQSRPAWAEAAPQALWWAR